MQRFDFIGCCFNKESHMHIQVFSVLLYPIQMSTMRDGGQVQGYVDATVLRLHRQRKHPQW